MIFYPTTLFQNISYEDYQTLCTCLSARKETFQVGDTICHFGVQTHPLGVLANGSASIVRFEANGSRSILYPLKAHDVFGELLPFQNTRNENICVICEKECTVLFLDYNRILSPCAKACACHHQLLCNLLQVISEKSIRLSKRVEVLCKRTIREKLLCYFMHLSQQADSDTFHLPFSLMDLADYLSVDRSAMSRELKRLKEDGLISMSHKEVYLLSKEKIMTIMT